MFPSTEGLKKMSKSKRLSAKYNKVKIPARGARCSGHVAHTHAFTCHMMNTKSRDMSLSKLKHLQSL